MLRLALLAALLVLPVAAEGVAPGFELSVYTDSVPNARQMAETESGTLFVGTRRAGRLYAVVPVADGDPEVVTIASGLSMPSGVALIGDDLYVAALDRVLRYPDIERTFRDHPEPEVVTDALPDRPQHGWKYLSVGPDGHLYVPVGAPCNICKSADSRFASILRMDPVTGETTVYAHGVRNSVGMAWHPQSGRLWFTDNGRDWMGDDVPPEEVNVVAEAGAHYGYPHVHGSDIRDPHSAKGTTPRNTSSHSSRSRPTRRRSASTSTPPSSSPPNTQVPCSSPSTVRGTAPPRSGSGSACCAFPTPGRCTRRSSMSGCRGSPTRDGPTTCSSRGTAPC